MKLKTKTTSSLEKKRPKRRWFKIRTKLILLLISITTASVVAVGYLSYQVGRSIIDEQINQSLSIQTERTLESINKMIFDRMNDMQLLIADSSLKNPEVNAETKINVLKSKLISIGWFEQLYLTDAEGKIVATTLNDNLGKSISQHKWFPEFKKSFIYVSDVIKSPFLSKNVMIFANTLQDDNNNVLGYVVAEFPLDIITDLLKNTPKNFEAYLISKDGKVIAFHGPPILENDSISQARIYQLPKTYLQQELKSQGYFSFSGNEWQLGVQILKTIAYEPINNFSFLLAILIILIILLVIILGHFSSKIFVKPILMLTEGVTRVRQGNLEQKIDIKSGDEVGYLANSFNAMTSEIGKKTNNLIEERGKYKTILESSNEGIILFDTKNNLVIFNQEFKDFFFKYKKTVPKKAENALSFISKANVDEESKKNVDDLQKIIQKNDFEKQANLSLILKNPYGIYALYTKPVLGEDGRLLGRIWVFSNITQEIESERRRAQFIHVASHKLRTPLTTVNWNAQMLMDGTFGKLSKDQRETIKQIKDASIDLNALSNILMNVAEIKKDQVSIQESVFELEPFLEATFREIKNKIKDKTNVTFRCDIKNAKGIKVKGDLKKIQEVLDILLDNALRYGQEGKKNKVELKVELDKKSRKAIISVSDHGIGIKEENKPNVFDQFFRSKTAELIYPDGTGLSLFLAKIILNSSGGKIWFESQANKQTTFFFTVKLA